MLQQVHLRINDAATGQPTPVRLRVTDAAGTYYPPHGHPADFATGVGEDVGGNLLLDGKKWAYIDGACEIALPPGALTVEAMKGPEYTPLKETVRLPLGKLALRFAINRWTDQRAEGWYSGDTRAHFLSPHAALLEAAAEDLAVVNVLAREAPVRANDGQTYLAYPNLIAFSGQRPSLECDGHLVAVNTLNTHPVLGKLGLLHCHRIVYPLSFGGADATDDWSLADWCGQCHRKGGLVVWADAFNAKTGHAGEALADLILGDVDVIELDVHNTGQLRAWYYVLNGSYRVPIAGGRFKDSNRTPLGALRTYVHLQPGEALSYTNWIEAVRGGRTYVTNGPLLSFLVNEEREGTVHKRDAGATKLQVQFAAKSLGPIERTELLANGTVVGAGTGPEVGLNLDLPAGGWLAVRCWQAGRIVAHTSPQYVQVEGVPPPVDPAAAAFLDGHLDRTREWIMAEGRFAKPASRGRLLSIITDAH